MNGEISSDPAVPAESTKKKVCATCQKEFSADSLLAVCPEDNTPLMLSSCLDLLGTTLGDTYKVECFAGYDEGIAHYIVRHIQSADQFRLKIFSGSLNTDEKLTRFRLQAQALSHLEHSNLLRVVDYGVLVHHKPYMVVENWQGRSLSQMLEDGPLEPSRAVDILLQICEALKVAHSAGFVHSFIKPSNIILLADGYNSNTAKLADLGVAGLLCDGKHNAISSETAVDSVAYASPEQCLERVVDARSDVYALGCVLYECFTGRRPFLGKTAPAVMAKHASAILPLPFNSVRKEAKLPLVLENVTFKALAKEPSERYQNAGELKVALEQARSSVAAPEVVDAFNTMLVQRRDGLKKEREIGRMGWIFFVAVVVVVVVVVAMLLLAVLKLLLN